MKICVPCGGAAVLELCVKWLKPKKAQIIVEPARDLADWKEYYRAYQASQQRWKVVLGLKFDWKLFEEMYNINSSKIKLWLAKLDGQVLCGAICFYHNKHVAYWHGAAFEEYFKLRPVNLLHYHIIEQAIQDRYWWYDFGPSANLKNLEDFKASFGSQKLASHILMNKNRTRQFFEQLKTTVKSRKFLA